MRRMLGVETPEPVVVTVTREVPADIPERFTESCKDADLLPHGSTLGDMLNHSNNRYRDNNECADKVDELRTWNSQDRGNSHE